MLESTLVSDDHRDLAARVRECLELHYTDGLFPLYTRQGLKGPFFDDGGVTEARVIRSRRLDLFMSQPYHGAEHFVGVPGETVSLDDTLEGCRQILEGEHDDVPEEAFHYVGTIEQALEKAEALAT